MMMNAANVYIEKVDQNKENGDLNDSKLKIKSLNPFLNYAKDDTLMHLGLNNTAYDLKEMFGDVKFICMGGTSERMLNFASYISQAIGPQLNLSEFNGLKNLSNMSDRYSMFKVGPVLSISHGIGCASISIVLHEIIKLIYYAKCKDVVLFRLGTCGGINVEPGTLVITREPVNGMFKSEYKQIILGQEVVRSVKFDEDLINELLDIGNSLKNVTGSAVKNVVAGRTLCTNDFYEEQGRLNGLFCDYTEDDKIKYLLKCRDNNIVNIEMESLCFASFLNRANIKGAVICVTFIDRLKDDQHEFLPDEIISFQSRLFQLAGEYIKRHL